MALPSPASGAARVKPGRRDALRQAVELQRAVYEVGLQMAKDAKEATKLEERARAGATLASLGKAWNTLQDAKRVIRGRPLPGSLKPEPKRQRPKRSQETYSEAGSLPTLEGTDPEQQAREEERMLLEDMGENHSSLG